MSGVGIHLGQRISDELVHNISRFLDKLGRALLAGPQPIPSIAQKRGSFLRTAAYSLSLVVQT
jgi:hypothetical protein